MHQPTRLCLAGTGQSALLGLSCLGPLSEPRAHRKPLRLIFLRLGFCLYYRVIRELTVGSDASSPSLSDICGGLSLTPEDLQFVGCTIAADPVLAGEGNVFLQRTIQEASFCSWCLMSQDDQVAQTRRGTRPGGPIADLLFSVLFVKTLEKRRLDNSLGSVPHFRWDGERSVRPAPKA